MTLLQNDVVTKKCRKCGEVYPASQEYFHGQPHLKDGLENRCKFCENKRALEYFHKHKNERAEYCRIKRQTLKLEVITAYGGKCNCCGETTVDFLTIDHVNGGGNKERQSLGKHASGFYTYIKELGFPKDKYRLLCMNCQFGYRDGKVCPHQQTKSK